MESDLRTYHQVTYKMKNIVKKKYSIEQPWLPFSELLLTWEAEFHNLMLNDKIRMIAYESAIKLAVKPGDVVVDIGTGTGILSLWALQAGASRVYGIDMDKDILIHAQRRMGSAGYHDKFIAVNNISYDVHISEKADLVISEIIGNLADNEDFQPIIKDAVERFLKPGGCLIPLSVTSYIVPVTSENSHKLVKNEDIKSLNSSKYSLRSLMSDKNITSPFNIYYDTVIPVKSHLSTPKLLRCYDHKWEQTSIYELEIDFVINHSGEFTGFKGYFMALLYDNIILDISADGLGFGLSSDSWKHAYLPVERPVSVKKDDRLFLRFSRSYPQDSSIKFRQIYRWKGRIERNSVTIYEFDQCLDETLLESGL